MFLASFGTGAAQWTTTVFGGSSSSLQAGKPGHQVGQVMIGSNGHAGYWASPGSFVDLHPSGATASYANATNGTQEGGSHAAAAYPFGHASLWSGTAGSMVDLNPAGYARSNVRAMSSTQQGGSAGVTLSQTHAALWSGSAGSFLDLHPSGGYIASEIHAMSETQQGGYARLNSGGRRALLWNGSADNYVYLHADGPTNLVDSAVYAMTATQQGGSAATVSGATAFERAAMWSGTAASRVDLHPAGASSSRVLAMAGSYQAGQVNDQAAVWQGSAASWVNLHALLLAQIGGNYTVSAVTGAYLDGGSIRLVGYAWDQVNGFTIAVMWSDPFPAPPVVILPPQSRSANAGTTITLSVTASGTAPLNYQWRKNGTNLPAPSLPTLTLANLVEANSGNYDVVVSNTAGSITSPAATITVNPIPTGSVRNVVNPGGSLNLVFNPAVVGTPSYQWLHNFEVIPGATGTTLALSNVNYQSGGHYMLVITDNNGTRRSAPVFVLVAPAATEVLAWGSNSYGQTAVPAGLDAVAVSGGEGFALALRRDGTVAGWGRDNAGQATVPAGLSDVVAISAGATFGLALKADGTVAQWGLHQSTLAPIPAGLAGVVAIAAGDTFALALKSDGSVVTWGSPSGSWSFGQPAPLTSVKAIGAGTGFSLVLKTDGSVLAWGSNLNGSTTVPAGLTGVTGLSGGYDHSLALKNDGTVAGWGGTDFGQLPVPPGLSGVRAVAAGYKYSFAVKSDGTLQGWGDSSSFVNTIPAEATDIFAVSLGTRNAGDFALAIKGGTLSPPIIASNPTATTVSAGNSASFAVAATGIPAPSYQWQRLPVGGDTWSNVSDGGAYSGTTTNTLSISAALGMSGDQFRCVASNVGGSVESAAATLTVILGTPYIITQPQPGYQMVARNATVTYQVEAGGQAPLSYQWKRNGANVAGANSATYTFTAAVGLPQETNYSVVISNGQGSVTSETVYMLILDPPYIYGQPLSHAVTVGSAIEFSVTAGGPGPLTYQWYKGGAAIPGATNYNLPINSAQLTDAGNYQVVVSNPVAQVTSDTATLTVSPANGAAIYAVAAGTNHSLFLRADGTLWAMGLSTGIGNIAGATAVNGCYLTPVQLATDVVGISASEGLSFWIKADGTLWGVGSSFNGEIGDGLTGSRYPPVQIATDVIAVRSGSDHTLFLKSDGTLWASGGNSYGQLGDGTNTARLLPVQIATNVKDMAAGESHSLFIKMDGTLWGMGDNFLCQLGDATGGRRSTPILVASDVAQVAAGQKHSLYIKNDGTLWGMGQSSQGVLGINNPGVVVPARQIATSVVRVAGGNSQSLYIRSDATLWGTGGNQAGALGDGSGQDRLAPIQISSGGAAVAGGYSFSLFAKTDGTVWTMGANGSGQLGNGTTTNKLSSIQVGSGIVALPAAPASVSVSDLIDGNMVRLSWRPSFGATSYEIWRSATSDPNAATRVAYNLEVPIDYDAVTGGVIQHYWVKAINATGASGFSVEAAPEERAPAITAHPASTAVLIGVNASFTAAATGGPAPTYQWQRLPVGSGIWENLGNGGTYSGATGGTLTITGATVAMSGDQFRCVATNTSGSDTSNAATLTVTVPLPVITEQPVSRTIAVGVPVSLFVLTSSPVPLTFQWKKDGVPIPGATDAMYSFFTSQESDSGTYTVVVTNSAGSVTSNGAVLVVAGPPQFTSHPASQTIFAGQNVTFSVGITSNAPVTYAWSKNNFAIPGATQSTYTITNAQPTDAGSYKVDVTSSVAGTVTSNVATLTVNVAQPVITTQPAAQTVYAGQAASFSVAATSGVPLSYVWRKNGTPIGGATAATYTIASAQAANAADYSVVVTNVAGSVTSNTATLTVNPLATPVFTTQPVGQSAGVGVTVQFTVAATGAPAPAYQWQVLRATGGTWGNTVDGAGYSGSQTATLSVVGSQLANNGDQYRCVASNVAGSATSNAATHTVLEGPVITGHPQSQTGLLGLILQFNVTATGVPAPTYQWQRRPVATGVWADLPDGIYVTGSTTPTLTVTFGAGWADQDQVRCVVSNYLGSATSNPATLSWPQQAGVVRLAAGTGHTLLIRSDGVLYTTGANGFGQLGRGNTTNVNFGSWVDGPGLGNLYGHIIDVAAGGNHSFYLKSDATLWAMGRNANGQLGTGDAANRLSPVQVAASVAAAAPGTTHSLYIKQDGTLWAMGDNTYGQLGDGTNTPTLAPKQVATRVVAAASAFVHSAFLKADGTLWSMGHNGLGELGDGSPFNRNVPVQTATGVVAISARGYHTLFIKTDGTLWAVGYNNVGQLGDGTLDTRSTPVQVATNVMAVASGMFHSLFVKTDGTLWAMGDNTYGQLGTGDTTARSSPAQVATGVIAVAAGDNHSGYITTDGSYWAMGRGDSGQLGDQFNQNRSTPFRIMQGYVPLPAPPTAVAASDASHPDRIAVSWTGGLSSGYYELWRGTTNVPAAATRLSARVSTTYYEDLSATPNQPYYYWVKGVNAAGTGAFSAGDAGIAGSSTPPVITTPPQSQTVNVGANVTFSVTATGTAPFTYQWRKGTTPIGGATASSHVITGAATTDAGSYDVVVTNAASSVTSAAAVLTVNKLAQAITFAAPADRAYTPLPFGLVATSDSSLPVTFSIVSGPATLSGSDLTITGVGTVTVRAAQGGNATYAAATNVERSFTVTKAAATVTLGSLSSTYDGTAKSATATTNPAGLNVTFTYDGSATPPTNAGSYAVVGTIAEANYQGTASGTLVIAKAAATVTLGSLTPTYDGTAKNATAATSPAGLNVTFTYDGSATAPTGAGSYAVVGTITEANYEGTASGTLVIAKATATVTLGNLTATYNGTAKSATATTNPANLTVAFTYNGSALAPTNAGGYAVVGTIADANYQGTASGTLVIAKAVATVTLGNLTPTYDGTAKSATATTTPAGLTVNLSYDGSPTAPTNAGSYAVVGTISDSNHQGSASGTLVIAKAVATVTLGNLTPTYDGTAKSATATTTPAGLTVDLTYDGSVTAPTNAGSYAIVGTVNEANYQGSASGTLVIAKADQTITFTGPANQPYSATPIILSATASSGLAVTFTVVSGPATVAGDSLTLTGAGAVTVRATQDGDANRNAAPAIDQSFTVTVNFASWRLAKFTEGELLDAAISGPNADPDHDGFANLLEYALGLEPKSASTTGLPQVGIEGSDWAYTYTRPADRTDVTYVVEMSTNLSGWGTGGVVHSLVSTSGGTETWRAKYPLVSAANCYFRLKVTGQ